MKMEDREAVAGTVPVITIGHRVRKNNKTGKSKASKWWEADYCHLGRKYHEPLNTTNKSVAIKAAWAIANRIERGETRQVQSRVEWAEMRDQHLDNLRGMGRKPKTMTKYTAVIDDCE